MAYATVEDVQIGFRTFEYDEQTRCGVLLSEAAIIIDAYNKDASDAIKNVVSCRIVRRALGSGDSENAMNVPLGATQGTVSALGYSQSWTLGNGSNGELYLSRTEKKMLGVGNRIGAHSPLEDMANA